ncbi:MAG: response regulator, partial [Anaerolineae bacterium]|nr:response regulator [Anaerolineae bacterium]
MLIIDDENSLLLGLKALMKREGYQTFTATSGSEGMKIAIETLPDIILCDVMMPPPNGFELRQILNDNPMTASIPFIFLTARTDQKDKLIGIKSGADDYITKPFDREELLARVEAVLRRTKLERNIGRLEMEEIAQEKMENFKQEILQNFHHELKTPLVNILLPLEAALSEKFSQPEDQIR